MGSPFDPCLSGLDEDTRRYFALRPYVIQHLLWSAEIQGDRITIKSEEINPTEHVCGHRCQIREFSRGARLRMLKWIAAIDWNRSRQGLWINLSYPPGWEWVDSRTRNSHLDQFHAYMENHLDREIPLLWRVEWAKRKTGWTKGFWAPHFHLITFKGRYIDKWTVKKWWKKILDHRGAISTKIDGLHGEKKFGVYIAKYASKPAACGALGDVTYPKVTGRHWGTLRKAKVPLRPLKKFVALSPRVIAQLQEFAARKLPDYRPESDLGFTLLGKKTRDWSEEIEKICLDGGCLPIVE